MSTNLKDILEKSVEPQGPPQPPSLSPRLQQELERRLDPDLNQAKLVNQADLGPAGMEDLGTRLKINMADTFNEKLTAFRQAFPKGELFKDPVNNSLLFRPDPATPFARVDAALLDKFEPLGDLIDFVANDLGAIGGELIATARTRGVSLIGLMARLFGGGAVGEIVQESAEEVMGFQQESATDIAARATMKGAIGAAGGLGGKGIELAVNFARGAGTVGLKPGATEAMRAAERQDVPQLMPFQVSDSPILRRLSGQAAALLPSIQRRINEQNAALTRAVNQMRDRVSLPRLAERLDALHNTLRGNTLAQANRITRKTEASDAGDALSQGVAEYAERSRVIVDEAYRAARDIETPQFDFTALSNTIDELVTGTPFATRSEPKVVEPFGFTTEAGRLTETTGRGRAEGPLAGELQAVIRNLRDLDPTVSEVVVNGQTFTTTDALLRLRRRLWDLKTPNPGELARLEHAQAGKLFGAITKVLDDPINANANFVRAWQSARATAADRFDTFDKLIVMRTARTEAPAQLADRLAQPLQVDNLKLLRSMVSNEQFGSLQNFFKSRVLRDPDGISASLGKFDTPTLEVLLKPAELTAFKAVGEGIDRLNRVGLSGILERQSRHGAIIREAVLRNETAQVDELFAMMIQAGGRTSDVGRSIRAALIDDFFNVITDIPLGQTTRETVRKAINSKIAELRAVGATKFLNRTDLKRILDVSKVKQFVDIGVDTGTSIQGAEAAQGLRTLSESAIQTVLENIGVGRLMTSNIGRRLFTGFGRDKTALPTVQRLAAALATAASDFEQEERDR